MSVRLAQAEHLEFLGRASARPFSSPLTGLDGKILREHYTQGYLQAGKALLEHPQLSLWVDEQSQDFLLACHQQTESLTQEKQTVILDWGSNPERFLPLLRQEARRRGDAFLVVRHYQGCLEDWSAWGFLPELRRLVVPTMGRSNRGSFSIRPIQAKDLMFLANLHSRGGQFYLPAGRQVDIQELTSRNVTLYLSLDLKDVFGWLVGEANKPFGYLLFKRGLQLEAVSKSAIYLYDINLKPEYWGTMASRMLLLHAFHQLAQEGFELVVGDVSCANPGIFGVATRRAGFHWESTRFGLKL